MEWVRTKPPGAIMALLLFIPSLSLCILHKTQGEKRDCLNYDENDSIFYL